MRKKKKQDIEETTVSTLYPIPHHPGPLAAKEKKEKDGKVEKKKKKSRVELSASQLPEIFPVVRLLLQASKKRKNAMKKEKKKGKKRERGRDSSASCAACVAVALRRSGERRKK